MENNIKNEFHDILSYCLSNDLYLGEGNPNGKILLIGKEIGQALDEDKTPSIDKSNADNLKNLSNWQSIIENNDLNNYLDFISNAFRDKPNRTWANYQKIVNKILGDDLSEKKYNFLDNSFITELNQIHLGYSSQANNKELKNARINSIEKRKELFKLDFFQNFPIVIMACGHYPREFNFDIEKIFNVSWDSKTVLLSKGNYYNVHFGKTPNGKAKILIHTRQVSLGITNELLSEIGNLCKAYF